MNCFLNSCFTKCNHRQIDNINVYRLLSYKCKLFFTIFYNSKYIRKVDRIDLKIDRIVKWN